MERGTTPDGSDHTTPSNQRSLVVKLNRFTGLQAVSSVMFVIQNGCRREVLV